MARIDDYRKSLQDSYLSECIGAELYSLLSKGSHGTSANHRKVLLILENVETQTRDILAELIAEAGGRPDQADAPMIARKINDLVANRTWESLHTWLLQGSQQGSVVYQKVKDYATNPTDERIASVLHHIDVVESIYRAEANGVSELDLAMKYFDDTRRSYVLSEISRKN